jgi:oligoendopeptidase F
MYVEPWVQPMDLSESQSQGNEWMYIHFLKQKLTPEMYQAVSEYRMSSDIAYIIGFVMVDQFEEAVYCHENAGNLTLEEYDGLMEAVAENYGGIDWVTENVMDVQSYWKLVVLESPVYYISYAVSAIAAVNLFIIAEEDRSQAEQCYCILMEQTADTQGFMESIYLAGLAGPFEETVYEKIYLRYGK